MKFFFIGAGYCSRFIIPYLWKDFEIICTHESKIKHEKFDKKFKVKRFLLSEIIDEMDRMLETPSIILNSIPPFRNDDILSSRLKKLITKKKEFLHWYGYLSSTSVYGNHFGNWVTEKSKLKPTTERGIARLQAEKKNMDLFKKLNIPVHIFRLPGIYGPGRSIVEKLKTNNLVIRKKNHFFSRIYVDDIAKAIITSIKKPTPGEIYNLTDDLPETSEKVADYASKIMNLKLSKIDISDKRVNKKTLDFYKENKKVSNKKIKSMLGWEPVIKNYRLGIRKILTINYD